MLTTSAELHEQAEQIKESSKDDTKFPFVLHYDPNQKDSLLSMLVAVGAVVESDDENGHKLSLKANMKQLAFIKKLDSIKRVSSHEGSNPFLSEVANAQTTPRSVDGNMTADATVMSMNEDDGIAVASVTDECCTPPTIPDGMASAREINVDLPVTSQITCPGAEQWFKVTIPNGGYYTIYTTGSLDTVGALYSDTGSLLREVDDYEPAGKINFRIYYPLITGYTYYVKVAVNNNATGSYQLMVAKKELVDSVQITGANENGVIVLEKGKTYEMPMRQGYTFQVADGETILQAPFGVRINPSNADNKDVYWTFSSEDGIGSVLFDHDLPEGCTPYQKLTLTKEGTGYLYAHDWNEDGVIAECPVKVRGWPTYAKPSINPRSSWNPRDVAVDKLIPRERPPQMLVFHHPAQKFSSTDTVDIIAEIQRIQDKHMIHQWPDDQKCDIAYHYIIDPAGGIWEGALVDGYKRGHADGHFDDIGVCVLGDFQSRLINGFNPNVLNDNQKNAMIELSKWLCYEYNLVWDGANDVSPIILHREGKSDTVCPGDNAALWIENELKAYIDNWFYD